MMKNLFLLSIQTNSELRNSILRIGVTTVKGPKHLILRDPPTIPEKTQEEGYQICNYPICKIKYMKAQQPH